VESTAPANQFDQTPNWFDEVLAQVSGVNAAIHAYQDEHNDTLLNATAGANTGPTSGQVLFGLLILAGVLYLVLE